MSSVIHPTAIVHANARLGEDVEIGPYSVIGPNVKIGDRTRIAAHVVIEGNTELGEENDVFQFSSIGAKPQDLKFHNEPSTLKIGSRNIIREFVTIHRGTEHGRMTTQIGDNNMFMANSHVGHDCAIGSRNVFANSVGLAGHVSVCNNAILGGLVGIHQFCRIGSYAMVSAGSMVGHDIPPYCIAQGDRCFLRGINIIGLQRAGFTKEQISDVKKTYRILFLRGGHLQAKSSLEDFPPELAEQDQIKQMLDFVASTQRGICSTSKNAKPSDI